MTTRANGFTLTELLVSIAVLVALVLLFSQLFVSASKVTTSGNKRMDTDAQVRPLFERFTVDFAQIVKRSDVDYYLKSSSNPQGGNDQIAFYSSVPGYYPSTGSQSPISVVAYRISAQNKFERMAKGLLWNGVSATSTPVVFLPSTISGSWPAATGATADSDYELIAPFVFRFEYYYLLKNGALSDTPWDSASGHTALSGLQDLAAISISIAAIDPKSRVIVSDAELTTLAGRMNDFAPSMQPGELLAQWRTALDGTTDIARPAVSAIRLYQRHFDLTAKQ
jgi:prepilin-type N-terminal cleavage/methylation domain-containing protein